MKIPKPTSRDIALAVVFGALYIVGVMVLHPISFMAVQFRVSEGLKILSVFLGPYCMLGLLLGEAIVNLSSPIIPALDFFTPWVGALPGMIIMYKWRKHQWVLIVGSVVHNIMLSAWVAMMLYLAFNLPFYLNWFTVFLGEFGSATVFGWVLYKAVAKVIPNYMR